MTVEQPTAAGRRIVRDVLRDHRHDDSPLGRLCRAERERDLEGLAVFARVLEDAIDDAARAVALFAGVFEPQTDRTVDRACDGSEQ